MSKTTAPTVKHFMTRSPHTVSSTDSLQTAHGLMSEYGIRHLPVVDGSALVGVVSQRDLYLLESLGKIDTAEVTVAAAMTERPYTIKPDTPLDDVAAHLAAYKAGSAVIVEDGNVVGIFTIQDALVALVHIWKEVPR